MHLARPGTADGDRFGVGSPPVGRDDELDWLDRWWRRARAGRAGRVLITGPAGIGKSSVVDRFCEIATDATIVRAGAEPGDAPGDLVVRLTTGAGLVRDPAGDIVTGLLTALGELQRSGPVLLVCEDLHWADGASATALSRLLRRLRHDQVLAVATAREGALGPPWPTLFAESADAGRRALGGLDPAATATLARTLRPGRWDRGALARLHEQTAGHPLYLVTLLRELPDHLLRGDRPLAAPQSLAAEVGSVVERSAEPTRTALAALAVLARPADRAVVERLTGIPRDRMDDVVTGLAATGLVEVGPGTRQPDLRLHHPLIAEAVREALGTGERERLHRSAARVLGGREALDHRIAAADGRPDPELAADLESWAAAEPIDDRDAATRLLAAAEVAADADEAQRLRLAAAMRMIASYDTERLRALAPALRDARPGAERSVALGFLASADGDPRAVDYQQAALDDESAPAEVRALAALRLALELSVRRRGRQAVQAARAASALTGRESRQEQALMFQAFGTAAEYGPAAGLACLDGAVDSARGADLAITAGTLHLAAGEIDEADARLREGLGRARRDDTATSTHRGHVHYTEVLFRRGQWDRAEAQAEIALNWFADGDRTWAQAAAHAAAALVPGARGQTEIARSHLANARAALAESPNQLNALAIAVAEAVLARSVRPGRMLDALRDLPGRAGRGGMYAGPFAPWRTLYAEALVEAGRPADADRLLRDTPAHEPLWFALVRHRLLGRIAAAAGDRAGAASRWRAGLDLAGTRDGDAERCPVEVAELRLALGAHHVDAGEHERARPHLAAARVTFTGLGATVLAGRTDALLRSRPDTTAAEPGPEPTAVTLTPRERQVTSCIVAGMTRREAAETLWVTPKAVDFHLGNVYAKLGISSRRELQRLSRTGTIPLD